MKSAILSHLVLSAIRWIFTIVAIGFIGYLIWKSNNTIIEVFNSTNFYLLILSGVLWCLLQTIFPIFTLCIFKAWHSKVKYQQLLVIHSSRLPAKYIPGGIWHSVARVFDYQTLGLTPKQLTIYFTLENLLTAAITLTFGGIIIAHYQLGNTLTNCLLYCSSLLGIVFIVMLPLAFRYINTVSMYSIKTRSYWLAVGVILVFWSLAACVFILFVNSFKLELTLSSVELAGIYIFSWGIGFITLFAPQGIGVSEFVSSFFVSNTIDIALFVTILASFRILILMADLTTWLTTQSIMYIRKKRIAH